MRVMGMPGRGAEMRVTGMPGRGTEMRVVGGVEMRANGDTGAEGGCFPGRASRKCLLRL